MASRYRILLKYRMQCCLFLIFFLTLLHMLVSEESSTTDFIQLFNEIEDSKIRKSHVVNASLSTSPSTLSYSSSPFSFDDEIELDFIRNEVSIPERELTTPSNILNSLQNSIKHVKDKIRKFQETTASESTAPSVRKTFEDKNATLVNKSENTYIDIKPLINMTINAFGLFDDVNPEEPYGPDDTKRVLHSMFQIWNPRASRWASKMSKDFKRKMQSSNGEQGNKTSIEHSNRKEIIVRIDECGCDRKIFVELEKLGSYNDSTCSKASYMRGPGQKVIGFSFYGNPNSTKGKERKYFQGIEDNLGLVPVHYPNWTVRVYYDLESDDPVLDNLCQLTCSNPNIDICHVRNNPSSGDISRIFAMNWRFFPTLDPQVDAFVSRDLDSRINSREKAAVDDWFKTNKHFHFMRDNPAHGIEILGSGWGVKMGPQLSHVRKMFRESFREASHDPMFWAERNAYGPDQGFLKRYIWPWAKWSALSHDSYFCRQFPRTSPFPTRRKNGTNNFVAAVVEAGDYLNQECPRACRPKSHPDWTTC